MLSHRVLGCSGEKVLAQVDMSGVGSVGVPETEVPEKDFRSQQSFQTFHGDVSTRPEV